MEYEGDGDTSCNWCTRYRYQRFGTGTGELGNKRTCGDYTKYSTIEIGQNTEMSPGDLKGFAITQTPVKNHQLTLGWKTLKWVKWYTKER